MTERNMKMQGERKYVVPPSPEYIEKTPNPASVVEAKKSDVKEALEILLSWGDSSVTTKTMNANSTLQDRARTFLEHLERMEAKNAGNTIDD